MAHSNQFPSKKNKKKKKYLYNLVDMFDFILVHNKPYPICKSAQKECRQFKTEIRRGAEIV